MPKRTNDGILKRCACQREMWAQCSHPWHFGFCFQKKQYRFSLDKVAIARNERVPTTKVEALAWLHRLRNEIRRGDFDDSPLPLSERASQSGRTFGDLCDDYVRGHINTPTRLDSAKKAMAWNVALIRRTLIVAGGVSVKFEDRPLAAIGRSDVEAFRDSRREALRDAREAVRQAAALESEARQCGDRLRVLDLRDEARALRRSAQARPGAKGGEVAINRQLARLRHLFAWAVCNGHIEASPFRRGGELVTHLSRRSEFPRARRVVGDEETRLLEVAGPHLRALIVATLESGLRLGELLSLQWRSVNFGDGVARWIVMGGHRPRVVPVSSRLRAILDALGHGRDLRGSVYVFGDEDGKQVKSVKRAWRTACRRAGVSGLHFHDLRREFACRLLDTGAQLQVLRDVLGHRSLATTAMYLGSSPLAVKAAAVAVESLNAKSRVGIAI